MQQAAGTGSIVVRFFVAHDGSDPVQLSWMAAEQKEYGDMVISGELFLHPSPYLLASEGRLQLMSAVDGPVDTRLLGGMWFSSSISTSA